MKQAAQQLVTFSITFLLSLDVLLAFGVVPSWKVMFLPVVAIRLFSLGAGLGLVVSLFSVVAADLTSAVQLVVGFMIYLMPTIYSDEISNPMLADALKYKTLTYLVRSARIIVPYGRLYDVDGFLLASAGSVVVFALALRPFWLLEHRLVELMI